MDAQKEPLRALPYAEQSSSVLRPADLVCHIVFAAGVALVLGGTSAIFYNYGGFFMEWYPHLITLGGFMVGLVVSLRWGRVLK